jgi:hypothetical protein
MYRYVMLIPMLWFIVFSVYLYSVITFSKL